MPRLLVLYASNSAVCGVGTWLEMLSDTLAERGWDVTVGLAWGRTFHQPEDVERVRPRLKTIRMDGRGGTTVERVAAVRKAIRLVDPDIVLVTLLGDGLAAVELEKRDGGRARVAVALHGNAPNHLAACLEHAARLDLVTCVNKSCELALRSLRNDPLGHRLRRIPNGVPAPLEVAEANTNDKTERVMTIGYVGRLHDDKRACDLEPLVTTLRESIDFRLLIAGAGPGESMIRQLATAYPHQVQFLGSVSHQELYSKVYPRLHTLVSFSPSEGWPMGIAEAMIHGVVPVCSEFSGIHAERVLRHGDTSLLFPVGRPDLAAEHIARLDTDRPLLSQLSRNANREVATDYSVTNFGDRWDSVLREVLAQDSQFVQEYSSTVEPRSWLEETWTWIRRFRPGRGKHDTARGEWPPLQARDESLRQDVVSALQAAHESIAPHEPVSKLTPELTSGR